VSGTQIAQSQLNIGFHCGVGIRGRIATFHCGDAGTQTERQNQGYYFGEAFEVVHAGPPIAALAFGAGQYLSVGILIMVDVGNKFVVLDARGADLFPGPTLVPRQVALTAAGTVVDFSRQLATGSVDVVAPRRTNGGCVAAL